MKENNEKKAFWLKLDNAAKIFPGQNSKTWSNSFRVCYELKEPVDPEILGRALKDVLPRFACYDVRIRRGFFWFYLEKNPFQPDVMPDVRNPCSRVKFKENNGFVFKVYYHGKRIAVDMYHVLTDGHGGALFLSTLVAQYLRLKGAEISAGEFVLDLDTEASEGELEDSFVRNATSRAKYSRMEKYVYHARGSKMPNHTVNITSGIIPFDEFHRLSRSYDVTVTEFLSAVMLDVLIRKQLAEQKTMKQVSIQIPVDLRRAFGSDSLRNFTICLRVVIDPNRGEYTFEELLDQVKYQLRLVNNKNDLNMMITANMGIERNPVIRVMPLFIKNFGVGISFLFTAEQTTSSLITNLGLVKIPEEMKPYIRKFIFMPGPGKLNGARVGVATLNNNLVITFANIYRESDVEKEFFTAFVKMGLHVKIESNRE